MELRGEVTKSLGSYSPTAWMFPTDWMNAFAYSITHLPSWASPTPTPRPDPATCPDSELTLQRELLLISLEAPYFLWTPNLPPAFWGWRLQLPLPTSQTKFREFLIELSGQCLPPETKGWRVQNRIFAHLNCIHAVCPSGEKFLSGEKFPLAIQLF